MKDTMGLLGGSKPKNGSSKNGGGSGGSKSQFLSYGSSTYKGKPQTDVYYGDKGSKSHGHIAINERGKTVFHEGPGKRSNGKN